MDCSLGVTLSGEEEAASVTSGSFSVSLSSLLWSEGALAPTADGASLGLYQFGDTEIELGEIRDVQAI